MYKVIDTVEYRVYKGNEIGETTVYLGGLNSLQIVENLKWNVDKENAERTQTTGEYLTLKEIEEQLKDENSIITVMTSTNDGSWMYQFNIFADDNWYMSFIIS